jgi:hypothetical protein
MHEMELVSPSRMRKEKAGTSWSVRPFYSGKGGDSCFKSLNESWLLWAECK